MDKNDTTFIALFRGINVGGNNIIPMATLSAFFVQAGCQNPKTYIQSGNVLFNADPGRVEQILADVRKSIADHLGLSVPIVLRDLESLSSAVQANPFPDTEPKKLHLVFLYDKPTEKQLANLNPDYSPPDQFVVKGSEIYLYLPQGAAGSKCNNAYFDSRLKTTSTMRNWKTVLKLMELGKELS